MKIRSLCLVLIFCVSLFPVNPVQAQKDPSPTFFDSLAMLYFSDAILGGYTELEETSVSSLLMVPALDSQHYNPDNAALAAALQAAKELRNDLGTNCALLTSQFRAAGKNCEADRIQATCDEKKAEINAVIGELHKERGDRRRPLTRFWHSLKRSGKNIWHRIGPVGRNFLRQVGPETLALVASGGTVNSSVLRNLFKNTAKNLVRSRIQDIAFQGVQHLISGQIELAEAAGVDICDPETGITAQKDSNAEENPPQEALFEFNLTTAEIDFRWQSLLEPEDDSHSCGSLWPGEDEQFKPIKFILTIDTQNDNITANFQGSRQIENLSEGTTGDVVSRQDQRFTATLDGPYEIDEISPGVVIALRGTANLTLTMDGERECSYWTVPASGGAVLNKYSIDRINTISLDRPYEVRIYSYDGQTGGLVFTIEFVENFAWNSGFYLKTEEIGLSAEDIQFFLADD